MDALTEAVVEWLQGERHGQSRAAMVAEIDRLARNCKLWPAATKAEWEQAIDAALEAELIVVDGMVLRIAPPAKQSSTEAPQAVKQLELFE